MEYMSKSIQVKGKELPSKKTFIFSLKEGRCAYLRKRECVCFCGGVIGIRCKDKSLKMFSTRIPGTPEINLLLCRDDRKTVVFQDMEIEEQWDQVFMYFFDDEGALLLCADKYYVSTLGPIFNVVPATGWLTLRQQALNIAAIFDEKLFGEIENLEKHLNNPSADVDLLGERLGGTVG